MARNLGRRPAVLAGLALLMGVPAAVARSGPPDVNQRAQAMKDFTDRCEEYATLHDKLASDLPKLPKKATPEQIAAHEDALAAAIRSARKDARQGDFFTPEISRVLLELVGSEFREEDATRVREAVRHDNPRPDLKDPKMRERPQPPPKREVVLAPNTPYPDAEPVSSVPPEVFATLPKLPEPLEYRFVGRSLVLRDRAAALIVDYLPKAIPASVGPR
jgi:hypothetical protein